MRIKKSAAAGLVTIAAASTLLTGSPSFAMGSVVPDRGNVTVTQAPEIEGHIVTDHRRRHRHRHYRHHRRHRHHRFHHRHRHHRFHRR